VTPSKTVPDFLTDRRILAIAIPVMVSNVSTPLIGVVDTGVVGQLPDPAYIGAVALGSLIFTFVFWGFGFLRMGTTGLTAQALGAEDTVEVVAVLGRALLLAGGVGAVLIVLSWPIRELAFALLEGPPGVESLARQYFDIRIWAAPVTLANYALLGWFIGMGRTGTGLVLQLVLNLTNIVLDAVFVLGFGWDVGGVALGTLLAEAFAAVAGLLLAWRYLRREKFDPGTLRWLVPDRIRRTLVVSGDIMIRSLALVFVFAWFTARGAAEGTIILAANAVLMHFVSVGAYFLDGLAFAAEALVGRAFGARNPELLQRAARRTTFWAVIVAGVIAAVLFGFGERLIDLLTVDPGARGAARTYLIWAAGAPLLGVWSFQLDGIFIGATATRAMRNAMLVSLAIYLAAWWLLTPWGNHGLWAALWVSYLARTATLGFCYPALVGSTALQVRSNA
jgi:MATE family multidrug resistance protein